MINQWISTSPKVTPEAPVTAPVPPKFPLEKREEEVIEIAKALPIPRAAPKAEAIPLLRKGIDGSPYTLSLIHI